MGTGRDLPCLAEVPQATSVQHIEIAEQLSNAPANLAYD